MKYSRQPGVAAPLLWCLVLLLVGSLSCRKDELPPPQLSAAFQIREAPYHPAFYDVETYDTDSVTTFQVSFIAQEPKVDTIRYHWQVGSDDREFEGRELTLMFLDDAEDSIPVRLTVSRWNRAGTVKLESRSSIRTFYTNRRSLALGTFEGYFDDLRSRKVVMKIEDDFKHPVHFENFDYSYTGLLVSTDLPARDTLFISNSEQRHYLLHRKIPLLNTTIIHFARYQFNRWVEDPYGEITVDPKTKSMTMNIKAIDIVTDKEITVKFTGRKIN